MSVISPTAAACGRGPGLDLRTDPPDERAGGQTGRVHDRVAVEDAARARRALRLPGEDAGHVGGVGGPARKQRAGAGCGERVGQEQPAERGSRLTERRMEAVQGPSGGRLAGRVDLAGAQVLVDQQRDPFDRPRRRANFAQPPPRKIRAEFGVTEEVGGAGGVDGARLRFADVVQQGGQTQRQLPFIQRRADARCGQRRLQLAPDQRCSQPARGCRCGQPSEPAHGVDLVPEHVAPVDRALIDAAADFQLREEPGQQTAALHPPQRPGEPVAEQDALQFHPAPLGSGREDERGVALQRRAQGRVRTPTAFGLEAHRSQESQRIIAEGCIADQAQPAARGVLAAAVRIEQGGCPLALAEAIQRQRHRVDGEVAAAQVALDVAVGQVPDIDLSAKQGNPPDLELRAEADRRRIERLARSRGPMLGISCRDIDVEAIVLVAGERIAQRPTDHPGPVRIEGIQRQRRISRRHLIPLRHPRSSRRVSRVDRSRAHGRCRHDR